jgi:hypothetical protein
VVVAVSMWCGQLQMFVSRASNKLLIYLKLMLHDNITVPLCQGKLFISRSCPILVLTTVLSGRPCHGDAKNVVNNYQGQLLPEKMRFENT